MALVSFEEITKKYEGKKIIDALSLEIEEGEIFGLIGRSGCGKTTLLKILLGMLAADSGNIVFDGKKIMSDTEILKRNTGFASQENMLFDELTLKENIVYYGKLYSLRSKEIEKRMESLLDLFELGRARHKLIMNLSGGMKKRANILVSLVHNPKLLVLDEPTVGLDPLLREKIWYYIGQINKLGKTIIVVSHLLEELEKNCTRVGALSDGQISRIVEIRGRKMFDKKSLAEMFHEELLHG